MVTVKKIKSIFPDQIILCQIYFFSKFFFVVAVLTMSSSSSGASDASQGAFDDLIPQGETAELDLGSDAPAASGQPSTCSLYWFGTGLSSFGDPL